MDHWILDESGEPVIVDLMTWARWFETAGDKRIVAQDQIGEMRVSTVFLGLDHSFFGVPPLIWETMILGGPLDGHQDRYTYRHEAVEGHKRACELARMELQMKGDA